MSFLLIGLIIGFVMGLTGAGGALVAIPLFMLLGHGLKAASVLSLFAVIIAALVNFIPVRKQVNYKAAFIMTGAGLLGTIGTTPLKAKMPELLIAILLGGISLFSLYMLWKPKKSNGENGEKFSSPLLGLSGVVLGGLTTLTGLGGGVVLMPLLKGGFHFKEGRAVATSVLTIGMTSAASLFIQTKAGAHRPDLLQVLVLLAGIIPATYGVTAMTKKMKPEKLSLVRKGVFTMVVGFALIKLFYGG